MFLACVGLNAGGGFIDAIVNKGGLTWIGYGFIITMLPLLVIGVIGRYYCKLNYFTLIGLLAGSTTDPPALAYAECNGGKCTPGCQLCDSLSIDDVLAGTDGTIDDFIFLYINSIVIRC